MAQFLQRHFAQVFAQTPLKGICTLSLFLNHLSLKHFANVFAHLNFLGQGIFKNELILAICVICLVHFLPYN